MSQACPSHPVFCERKQTLAPGALSRRKSTRAMHIIRCLPHTSGFMWGCAGCLLGRLDGWSTATRTSCGHEHQELHAYEMGGISSLLGRHSGCSAERHHARAVARQQHSRARKGAPAACWAGPAASQPASTTRKGCSTAAALKGHARARQQLAGQVQRLVGQDAFPAHPGIPDLQVTKQE